jgi:hypothetical protein
MTRWVLADYGEVISDPMPAETILELADLAGQQADEFRDRYWKFRLGPSVFHGRVHRYQKADRRTGEIRAETHCAGAHG